MENGRENYGFVAEFGGKYDLWEKKNEFVAECGGKKMICGKKNAECEWEKVGFVAEENHFSSSFQKMNKSINCQKYKT